MGMPTGGVIGTAAAPTRSSADQAGGTSVAPIRNVMSLIDATPGFLRDSLAPQHSAPEARGQGAGEGSPEDCRRPWNQGEEPPGIGTRSGVTFVPASTTSITT